MWPRFLSFDMIRYFHLLRCSLLIDINLLIKVSLLTEGELMTDGDLCPSESSSICLQESMEQLKTVVDDLKKNCEVDRISEGNEANCTSVSL